ncbi:maternal protein pumilio-like isoform X2 [Amphibalanus amphitrite]|uniref:maternal protein pumilio-like isoform X2 n=1 Tax=Amphibalanus amphitrite TaxID=1232801 RepID=UPI001C90EDA5|nr:maternal protein pumilio-like isoform X2 [Amphibalanus amphitrite]
MGVVTVERNMKLKDKRYVTPHELMLYKPLSSETKNNKRNGQVQPLSNGLIQHLLAQQQQQQPQQQQQQQGQLQQALSGGAAGFGLPSYLAPGQEQAAMAAYLGGGYPATSVGYLPMLGGADGQVSQADPAAAAAAAAAAGQLPYLLPSQQPLALPGLSLLGAVPGGAGLMPPLVPPGGAVPGFMAGGGAQGLVVPPPGASVDGGVTGESLPLALSMAGFQNILGAPLTSVTARMPTGLELEPLWARPLGLAGLQTAQAAGLLTASQPQSSRRGHSSRAGGRPARGRFLEEFRNNQLPGLQIRDAAGHLVEFSQDQHGSRWLQQRLEHAADEGRRLAFDEIAPHAFTLMDDVFGNYVIQKLFELGTPEQRATLLQRMQGHIVEMSVQMYGCRVVQKALETLDHSQLSKVTREFDGHVVRLCRDQNGNHVIQKCFEAVNPIPELMVRAFRGHMGTLSANAYGCRVIQRLLEHAAEEQTRPLVDELHSLSSERLLYDQYANYVAQHIVQFGAEPDRRRMAERLRGRVLHGSRNKYCSPFVEKCLQYAPADTRQQLIEEVLAFTDQEFFEMCQDQYGNYVYWRAVENAGREDFSRLTSRLMQHLTELKRMQYAKHLVKKIEELEHSDRGSKGQTAGR